MLSSTKRLQGLTIDLTQHKPSVTNEGTGVKLGVLDVTEEELSKSEAESWGNDKDDSNNEQDSSDEDDKEEVKDEFNDSDDEDETKITDKSEGDEDEEMDYTTNIPHTDAEIVSPMDVGVHHEVPSQQTPTLPIVPISVISDSSPVFSTVIPHSLPSFTPPP
nr:hypothetical protein [Tanacetum cinerariifolium]